MNWLTSLTVEGPGKLCMAVILLLLGDIPCGVITRPKYSTLWQIK